MLPLFYSYAYVASEKHTSKWKSLSFTFDRATRRVFSGASDV